MVGSLGLDRRDELVTAGLVDYVKELPDVLVGVGQGEEVDANQVAELLEAVVEFCCCGVLRLAEANANRTTISKSCCHRLVGSSGELDGSGQCARARVTEVGVQGLNGDQELGGRRAFGGVRKEDLVVLPFP